MSYYFTSKEQLPELRDALPAPWLVEYDDPEDESAYDDDGVVFEYPLKWPPYKSAAFNKIMAEVTNPLARLLGPKQEWPAAECVDRSMIQQERPLNPLASIAVYVEWPLPNDIISRIEIASEVITRACVKYVPS